MYSHVFRHQIISTELLPAHYARVRFLSCMDSHMYVQIAHMAELFPTNPATVWFLLRVNPHMHCHTVSMSKLFTTHLTGEQFIIGVDLCVCDQMWVVAEFFATETTAVGSASAHCLFIWWSWTVWFATFSQLLSPCGALCGFFIDTVVCQRCSIRLRPHVIQSHREIWQKSPISTAWLSTFLNQYRLSVFISSVRSL